VGDSSAIPGKKGGTIFGDMRDLVWEQLRSAVARFQDAELFYPVTESVWMKVQDPSRALWTINHSVDMLKDCEDMASLYLGQSLKRLWRLFSQPLLRSICF
jgi:hypothetical protein